MADTFIAYARELPEIPDRRPWEPPECFLVRDDGVASGWRIDDSGRRPSNLLLIEGLRQAVGEWRASGYPGASEVASALLSFWFDRDHSHPVFGTLRYHFAQREAIETLIYLVEIIDNRDTRPLLEQFAGPRVKDLPGTALRFETPVGGPRQVSREDQDGSLRVQDLPLEDLRRYAFKMATGSGKTWVMAMAVVWSYFHKRMVPGSDLSTNFLIVAPNVIVFERLKKDFAANSIFRELPLVPPEWESQFDLAPVMRGEATELRPSGNLVVTNIQQIYEREESWQPANPVEALLGRKPPLDLAAHRRPMLDRLRDLRDLVVMNDEAHHVHDEDLKWAQALLTLHNGLQEKGAGGLSLWLDFSATPKDQKGMYFPWTICDYPLAQAVEDRVVKAPVIVTMEGDAKIPDRDPEKVKAENAVEEYGFWIDAAVKRWKEHAKAYKKVGLRPVLFITAETTRHADAIGNYLASGRSAPFRRGEVLIIHTDSKGEITKKDLDLARDAARDIDNPDSTVKAIVSVMMLKEGWDVRNVTVVLGLRPFSAKAEILPEQVIGRGLRIMRGVGPERTQTLEVLGTRNLLKVLKEQLEQEGVGVGVTKTPPPQPVWIEPVEERRAFDIAIPLTRPTLHHEVRKLEELKVASLKPIYAEDDLAEAWQVRLRAEFATPGVDLGTLPFDAGELPIAQDLVGDITRRTIEQAHLTAAFASLYPMVRDYLTTRCFGRQVELDDKVIRSRLREPLIREAIAKYLARSIGLLVAERREMEFEKKAFRLSQTRAFQWRRDLPPLVCTKTVFNYVATYNKFERQFAQFLDHAEDVLRFASLGTTQQGEAGTQFKVDYLKLSGAIGFYHPDFVVVQGPKRNPVNWIVETKGRVWEGTEQKDLAMAHWCDQIRNLTGEDWRFLRVNQADFRPAEHKTFAGLLESRAGLGVPAG